MQGHLSDRSHVPGFRPVVVFGVLAVALAVRFIHFSSALQSPLSFQPGPDENYYLRFGEAVATGHGANSAEFTFMDPGYGYLLGTMFKVIGVNPAAIYLLQTLLDTATAYGILIMGRLLGRPSAGLYGALLYGLTSTAIMFCTTLLKETWVASYVTWWVVGALALLRTDRKLAWALFGAFCGVGVALRSTLMLLGVLAVVLPVVGPWRDSVPGRGAARWASKSALILLGMAVSLMPWTLRNFQAFGSLSPLPHNGGIVLHQAYNAGNPASAIWIPSFVNYFDPSEIWRGYEAEADLRSGRTLSPREVDEYWQREAFAYMREHPGRVLADAARKSLVFLADSEIPNNRSSAEERLFSPVLRVLPPPMAWLLAMGLAGLVWLALQDRRWPVVAAPIVVSWLTVAAFWAEDRFRFHAAPVLALSSGIWIDGMALALRTVRPWPSSIRRQFAVCGALAAVTGAASVFLGARFPPPAVRWDHIVWGYIKMGRVREARTLADRISLEQPDNGPVWEALGYLSAAGWQYADAARNYRTAITLRPRSYLAHYNLAKALLALEDGPAAAAEARIALRLNPSGDAEALLRQAEAMP